MRQRLKVGMIFFAWFMATGSQWDVVQVVAWGRMFAGYSEEMSLSAAAKKTFSGEMCGVCQIAQDGRKQQESNGENTPPSKAPGKLFDLCAPTVSSLILTPQREPEGVLLALIDPDGRGRSSPPSPPPRV